MTLCDLCASIPLEGLPPFPSERYHEYLSGKPHFQHGGLKAAYTNAAPAPRFPHQPNLESLRRAAAAGCELCHLIQSQVDSVLSDVAAFDELERETIGAPEDFALWLTKRPDGGQGFWAVTEVPSSAEIYLLAAIAFCAEEGEFMPRVQPEGVH